ncbi:MAG: hypothetical protein Q9166_001743 [cf. Caloplaca sp. 2 TL-2023]
MPAVIDSTGNHSPTKKRKRQVAQPGSKVDHRTKVRKIDRASPDEASVEGEILLLEGDILKSRKHYNKIPTLVQYCKDPKHEKRCITAVVALCRVFCRLMAMGSMSKPREASESEVLIVQWLRSQYDRYNDELIFITMCPNTGMQSLALTLLMRLLKAQSDSLDRPFDNSHRNGGVFHKIIASITSGNSVELIRQEFVKKYAQPYDDVRYYTLACLNEFFEDQEVYPSVVNVIIEVFAMLDPGTGEKQKMDNFYQKTISQKINSVAAHKKLAQELWMNILRSPLSKSQRKTVLNMMISHIVPWFNRLELLMDFLTDSFNAGGSTSLAAISGLFHLMREKNLDYPQFYPKLYSLLTAEILYSKHRSRFFRLLDTFLSSTHLPAALVASFIKRLARLTLFAPPSGVVVVVPWIYNLLKNHPSCTFMIHRRSESSDYKEGKGMDDPFNMADPDPMETKAIDSSLWEIHTLQSHYHPNVATIAKIISEQFTKQAYNLEDFLDHSYSSMLNAELSKEVKKPPVIEYEIPKKIFFKNPDPAQSDSLLVKLWDFS